RLANVEQWLLGDTTGHQHHITRTYQYLARIIGVEAAQACRRELLPHTWIAVELLCAAIFHGAPDSIVHGDLRWRSEDLQGAIVRTTTALRTWLASPPGQARYLNVDYGLEHIVPQQEREAFLQGLADALAASGADRADDVAELSAWDMALVHFSL